MTDVSYNGMILRVGEKAYSLEYPLVDAFEVDDGIVVLFDPDALEAKSGQFRNLRCLSPSGDYRWVAELPTNLSGDRYYRISSRRPLVAYSVKSFACTIDSTNGQIVAREFFK
jgi:hypothetical protein